MALIVIAVAVLPLLPRVETHHRRPPRPADAVAGGGGDHAGLPDGLHADGHGHDVRLLRLSLRRADGRWRDHPDARPDGAARLLGDGQRRADRDPAVRLHGLSRGARQPDREAVRQPAPCIGAGSRFARRCHAGHLRGVRHRHRHRRRGGHADGPAGPAADAARGLRRSAVGRRDHRRRLPGHPDPAVGAADRRTAPRPASRWCSCMPAPSSRASCLPACTSCT